MIKRIKNNQYHQNNIFFKNLFLVFNYVVINIFFNMIFIKTIYILSFINIVIISFILFYVLMYVFNFKLIISFIFTTTQFINFRNKINFLHFLILVVFYLTFLNNNIVVFKFNISNFIYNNISYFNINYFYFFLSYSLNTYSFLINNNIFLDLTFFFDPFSNINFTKNLVSICYNFNIITSTDSFYNIYVMTLKLLILVKLFFLVKNKLLKNIK